MSKPKPTHLKILQGNPGKRALNKNEPIPENELGDPPSHMTEGAKDVWRYILEESPAGMIKSTDAIEMTVLCTAFDIYLQAADHLRREGMTVVNAVGLQVPSPWISVMGKQTDTITKITSNMGLSPSSRSRINVKAGAPKEQNQTDFSVFSGKKK